MRTKLQIRLWLLCSIEDTFENVIDNVWMIYFLQQKRKQMKLIIIQTIALYVKIDGNGSWLMMFYISIIYIHNMSSPLSIYILHVSVLSALIGLYWQAQVTRSYSKIYDDEISNFEDIFVHNRPCSCWFI